MPVTTTLPTGNCYARLVVKTSTTVLWSNELGPFQSSTTGCGSMPFGWVCGTTMALPSVPGCTWARVYFGLIQGHEDQYLDVTAIVGAGGGTLTLYNIATAMTAGLIVNVPPYPIDIFDDTTPIVNISGASVEIYAPNTSPNSGDDPELRLGTPIGRKVVNIKKFQNVNGQSLLAPNAGYFHGNGDIRFEYPATIRTNRSGEDFTKRFAMSDELHIDTSTQGHVIDPGGAHGPVDLDGTYQILSVSADHLVLSNPAAVNAAWNTINTYTGGVSTYAGGNIYTTGPRWIGPFLVNVIDATEIWTNFVAPNGLYKQTPDGQQFLSVDILLGITAVDGNGTPVGFERYFRATINGSAILKTQRAITLEAELPLSGPCLVRAQRLTPGQLTTGTTTIVDDIKWRDLYSVSPVIPLHFGNVTTIQSLTYATEGALSVKNRKLNLIVTRKIKTLDGGGNLSVGISPSKRADDIICALATDPYIGNRAIGEIDTLALRTQIQAVRDYFGDDQVVQFCFTFDDAKVSFEESLADVATACFCIAYRRGNIFYLQFEKKTVNSTLLFNHRNKVPKSETRTVTFGMTSEFDGIEYDYVDPISPTYQHVDTKRTLYFPQDLSAKNAKKITSIGVRNFVQATLQGWRLFQKLKYQNTAVQFDATEEAALCVISERILVADNTRSDTQDGEVVGQAALILDLSQPVIFKGGHTYTIYLQHNDGTMESLGITAGATPFKVVLAGAPSLPLVVDVNNWARSTYMIVSDEVQRPFAFLLQEKNPKGAKIYEMKAINYDDHYYDHDRDVPDHGLVDPAYPPANGAGYVAGAGYPGDAPTGDPPINPPDPPDDGGGDGGLGGHLRGDIG